MSRNHFTVLVLVPLSYLVYEYRRDILFGSCPEGSLYRWLDWSRYF